MISHTTKTYTNVSPLRDEVNELDLGFCGDNMPFSELFISQRTRYFGGGMANINYNIREDHVYGMDINDPSDYEYKSHHLFKDGMMHRHFEYVQVNDEIIDDLCFSFIKELQEYDEEEKEFFFYHKDHLGSSTQISNIDANIIHHIEKFVSKSYRETLETTNSGLVWMSFISDCSHNFSNYESRLNIEYMPSGEQFSEQHCSMPLSYIFNAKQLNIKHLSYTLGKWFGIKPQIFQ